MIRADGPLMAQQKFVSRALGHSLAYYQYNTDLAIRASEYQPPGLHDA